MRDERHHILVVDHNESMASLCRLILESRGGYRVTALTDASSVDDVLQRDPCDLMLLELLPRSSSAIDLTQRLRENPVAKHIPVVFMSAHDTEQARTSAFLIGDDVIRKPFSDDELLARVDARLRLDQTKMSAHRHLSMLLQFLQTVLLHEIKTPLSVLKGNNHLLTVVLDSFRAQLDEKLGDDTGKQPLDRYLMRMEGMIHNQGKALDRFQRIADEVSLAVEAGSYGLTLTLESITVGEVIAGAIERLHDDRLQLDLQGKLDTIVMADADRFADALFQLIDNAGRHNHSDQPWCRVSVDTPEEGWVAVHVQDNGYGIRADDPAMIFEPFYLAHNLSQHSRGIGLGLYLAKRIMERMGGKLELTATDSGDEHGSTFSAWIPVSQSDSAAD